MQVLFNNNNKKTNQKKSISLGLHKDHSRDAKAEGICHCVALSLSG